MNKTAAAGEDWQPARESNIEAFVSFFESGVKRDDAPGELGIELEHIVVHDDLSPVSYSGDRGIEWVLRKLTSDYHRTTYDSAGDLLGVSRPNEAVTIEPAAQLELSAGPYESLDEASTAFSSFERTLEGILAPVGECVAPIGYHPTATAMSLELIPKRRYEFMDRYLGSKGKFGPYMMRGSASTQVSIDYFSREDCLRKLRLSYALVPLFALMCDNSPVFEGRPRTHRLVRTKIWQRCDPDRCGVVPGALEKDFSLRRYAEYLLDTPAILVPSDNEEWQYSEDTFGDIYANQTMTRAEVEHAVSMFFNDVRLKTYIEIRPADAMPIPYVMAYAALIKGLFYDPKNLDELDVLFSGVDAVQMEQAKNELMADGYQATTYGRSAAELCDRLVELSYRGLGTDERHYLDPLAKLVERRTTLADETLLDLCCSDDDRSR